MGVAMAEAGRGRLRLRVEFALIYLVAPVTMAVALPPSAMFPALFAVTALGIGLLHLTPGFYWRDLLRGWNRIGWGRVAVLAALTALCGWAVLAVTAPGALFGLARSQPGLLVMIALLYPLLSALPQELVFRPLFFRRYGPILPALRPAVVLNAAVFSLAHLMYWSWIVAAMTLAGGLAFAWSYEARRNFPEAVVLHALAGVILFTVGMGVYFYSGNVSRPF
jgi:membrane protease YdiL (CAAX protease family)